MKGIINMSRFSTMIFLVIAALVFNGCDSCTAPVSVDATADVVVDASDAVPSSDAAVDAATDAVVRCTDAQVPHQDAAPSMDAEPGC
jgi:hypothetical protein